MPIRRLVNYAQQRAGRPELWLPIAALFFSALVTVTFVQSNAQTLFPFPHIENFRPEPLIILVLGFMWITWLFTVAMVFTAIAFWIVAGCIVWKHRHSRTLYWSVALVILTPLLCVVMVRSLWIDSLLGGPQHERQTFGDFTAERVATGYYDNFFFPRDREMEFGGDAEWTLYWKDTVLDPCREASKDCRNSFVAVRGDAHSILVVRGRNASGDDRFWMLTDANGQVTKELIGDVPAHKRKDCEESQTLLFRLDLSDLVAAGDGVVLDLAQKKPILLCPLSRLTFDDHADVPIAISPDRRWVAFLDRGRTMRIADTLLEQPTQALYRIVGGPASLDAAPEDRSALPELQQAIIWTSAGIKLKAPFRLVAIE